MKILGLLVGRCHEALHLSGISVTVLSDSLWQAFMALILLLNSWLAASLS
jgi:hypothetical protein